MSIQLASSGFHEWHDYQMKKPGLGIDSRRVDDCLAHCHAHGFAGPFGTKSFGFDQDNLDFLTRVPNGKWFCDVTLKRLDAVDKRSRAQPISRHG